MFRFRCGLLSFSRSLPVLRKFKELLIMEDWESSRDRSKKEIVISMTNTSFKYRNIPPTLQTKDASESNSKRSLELSSMHNGSFKPLVDINLQVHKGSLVGVVGSDSSTLLLAILGQLRSTQGFERNGSFGYVNGNKPWLLEGAEIRDNIMLMGEKFHQKHYYQTLHSCCLHENMHTLQHGERTVVENSNLTPSEAQRIALARVAYSGRDIYLLDKPLSEVGADIADEVFKRTILTIFKEKTVIIATDNIQHLSKCDKILVVTGGQLVEQGKHEALLDYGKEYSALVRQLPAGMTHYLEADCTQPVHNPTVSNDNLVVTVPRIHYALGWFSSTIVVLLMSVAVLFTTLAAIIINIHTKNSSNDWFNWFMQVQYAAAICVAAAILNLIWRILFSQTVRSVSQHLHSSWVRRLLGACHGMLPSKQVLQQTFSLHTQLMNDTLTHDIRLCIENFAMLVACAGLLMFKTPWSLVPLALFYAASVLFIAIYRGASLGISNTVSVKKKSLIDFVDTTVEGRTTIKCLSRTKDFTEQFSKLCDSHASNVFLLQNASYWISVRIHMLAVFFIGGVVFAGCNGPPEAESYLFVVLVAAWQLPGYTRRAVKGLVATESGVHALKKANELMFDIEQEVQDLYCEMIDGSIDFSGVHTNAGLQGVTFNLSSGAKNGVFGGGRSAVIDALYGIVDITLGVVTVGNVSLTSFFGSHRKQIGIVPSGAPMLSLSLKLFLNPEGKHTEDEIRELLSNLGLQTNQLIHCKNISHEIFSRKQREFLWFARAALSKPKILVLQESLHISACQVASFLPETTVLVMSGQMSANELIDMDQVIVITDGKLTEFGQPQQLYRSTHSVISQMIASSTGNIFETEL